jgi:PAS domain S-box-containing protein
MSCQTLKGSPDAARGDAPRTAVPDRSLLAAIVESSDDAIISETLDGVVTGWNRGAEQLFGYTAEEMVGSLIARLADPDHAEDFAGIVERVRRGDRVEGYETRRRTKDGRIIDVSLTVSPIRDGSGGVIGAATIARGITERKQLDAAVRDGEERYRALSEATSDAVVMHEAGTVLDVNEAFTRMFGYEASEVVGANALELLVSPEDRDALWERIRTGSAEPYEAILRRKDGSILVAEIRGKTISYRGRTVRVASVHDVTERKRAEEAARDAEGQLRLITDTVPAFISYVDLDLRYRLVNHTYEAWFGRPREQIIGRPVRDVMGEEAWSLAAPWVVRAMSGEAVHYESEVPCPEGGSRWMDVTYTPEFGEDGGVRGVVVLVTDITERKRAEAAHRESEARLSVALSAARMMAWESDVRGGLTRGTEESERLWGFRDGTAEDFRRQIHPDDLPMIDSRWADAVARGGDYVAEYRVRRLDGERWYATRGRVVRSDNGDEKMVGVTSDITGLKRAEAALRNADRRKDEFLAMLAHELRNPLAAIGSGLQLLQLAGSDPENASWSMEIIGKQVDHLSRMIDDLLDVSRISNGKIMLRRESLELTPILESAVAAVSTLIEQRGHTLEVSIDRGTLWTVGDPTRLEQVVVNLLTNAAKYSEDGGHIRLSALNEGEDVVISVKDHGIGIPPETLPLMFELFAQGDRSLARSEGGLGIGLTVVKKLVELHGGIVSAASEGPGKGCEFTVRLPRAARPATPGAATQDPSAGVGKACRILVVEDDEDTACGMAKLLRHLGHDVATAYSGPAALEAAREHRPGVILLDLGLPGMDGYEVAYRLRRDECCRDAIIIAVSGYGQDEDIRRSRQAGVDHHLVKPVRYDNLLPLLSPGANGHG